MTPRRALILASASRYLVMMLQVISSLVVAHHVLPDQFGLTVLGNGALLIAGAIRELGSTSYLVQQKELTEHKVRSAFTVSLVVTMLVTAALLLAARPIAVFYADARLADYVRVMAIGYALEPFLSPITALMAREMAFRRIAVIEVVAGGVNAFAAMLLIKLGVGFMAVAWAVVARGLASIVIGFWFQRNLRFLRPSLRDWRGVLKYGVHGSATTMVYQLGEAFLFLAFGKALNPHSVGLIQRAYLLTQLPDRVLLAGVAAVAMPAFSELHRNDEPLGPAYIHSVALVSPIYLAATAALVPLARPLVLVLLGPAWLETVPLVQLIAAGHLLGVAGGLNVVALIASGGIRQSTPLAIIQIAILLATTLVATPHGLTAVAATAFVSVPTITLASLLFLRRRITFPWRDFHAAVLRGVAAAAAAMAGPAIVAAATDWPSAHPLLALVASTALGGAAWLASLALMRHALFDELTRAFGILRVRAAAWRNA